MSKLGSLHRLANADQGQIRPPVAGTAAQAAAGKGRAQRPVRMRRLVNWQSCGSCSSQKTRLITALLKGIKAGSLSAKAFAFAAQVRRSCCPVLGLLPRSGSPHDVLSYRTRSLAAR